MSLLPPHRGLQEASFNQNTYIVFDLPFRHKHNLIVPFTYIKIQ